MILRDLTQDGIAHQLASGGLKLKVGALGVSVHTPLTRLAAPLALLYADYPLATDEAFIDFTVAVKPTRGLGSLLKRMVEFRLDGRRPFLPMPFPHAFPLLEWGLNWCVATTMHCWLIIHAAVLARDDHGLILPGRPGSGKSTLTAVLASRGWRLLSDEHAILDPATGLLVPAPRPISLKNESIDLIRSLWPDAVMSQPVLDTHKGTIAHLKPSTESVAGASTSAKPRWVVFPSFVRGQESVLSSVGKGEALVRLAENSFNYPLHGSTGFHLLADVVAASDTLQLSFGSATAAADLIDDLVS